MKRLHPYFSKNGPDEFFCDIYGRNYGSICEKIPGIPVKHFLREINIKPVLQPYVDNFKKTPETTGNNDEERKASVQDQESFCLHCQNCVNEKYIRPPCGEIEII
jgi:hypothetical protein